MNSSSGSRLLCAELCKCEQAANLQGGPSPSLPQTEGRWPKCEKIKKTKTKSLTKLVLKELLNVQEIIGREVLTKRREQVCGLVVACRRWGGEKWEVGTESEERGVLVDTTQQSGPVLMVVCCLSQKQKKSITKMI